MNFEHKTAELIYKQLQLAISDFEQSLTPDEDILVCLSCFGNSILNLETIGYCNPYMLCFTGTSTDGKPVRLIQHINQVNVLLQTVPRFPQTPQRIKIGFVGSQDFEQ